MVSAADAAQPPMTTALAVRAPDALDHELRFYDRGGTALGRLIGVGALGVVVMGVGAAVLPPVGAGMAFMAGLGVMGSGVLLAMRTDSVPGAIVRARAKAARHPEMALRDLERLARTSTFSSAHRLEAAGHAALLRLVRGEVDEAVIVLAEERGRERGAALRRGVERGLLGELMRSLLEWIRPGSFTRVAHSSAFEVDAEQRRGLARSDDVGEVNDLVALLRLFESTVSEQPIALLQAWHRVTESTLAKRLPTLHLVARAVASSRIAPVAEELESELERNASAREILGKLLPEYAVPDRQSSAYREAALVPGGQDEADRALAVMSAPKDLQSIVATTRGRDAYLTAVNSVAARLAGAGALGMAWMMLTFALIGTGAGEAFLFLLMAGALVTPLPMFLGNSKIRTRARLAALWNPKVGPPAQPWTQEFLRHPMAKGGSSSLRREDLVLYAGCLRAEKKLEEGDAEGAWEQVQWWFRGLDLEHFERSPLYPVAAHLVSVAALCGRLADGRRLAGALGTTRDRTRLRSAYGDAPGALAFARAVLEGKGGRWELAARYLREALEHPVVECSPRQRTLHCMVARRARAQGFEVPDPLVDGRPDELETHGPWVRTLWPDL